MTSARRLDTVPFQPVPIDWYIQELAYPGGLVAEELVRVWAAGDTRRCRLCAACTANHERGFCTMLVDQRIDSGSAPLFSTKGLTSAVLDAGQACADGA